MNTRQVVVTTESQARDAEADANRVGLYWASTSSTESAPGSWKLTFVPSTYFRDRRAQIPKRPSLGA